MSLIADDVVDYLDNGAWQKRLRAAACDLKNCEFPANREIGIYGTLDEATITVRAKGLAGNMQTNSAAFEAWALALLCHCQVKRIKIGLEHDAEKLSGGHVGRFLYRLHRFYELFPHRIEPDATLLDSPRALNGAMKRILNQPSTNRPRIDRSERFAAVSASSVNVSESKLEKALECSRSFIERFALRKVMRQWPVGLFEGRVARDDQARIFTGGKSAIDLIGVSGDSLVLFELKTHSNRSAGAISELLFYASVMRDAIRGEFQFENVPFAKNCVVTREDILGCSNIRAVLIAPRMHPLIRNPAVLQTLNTALTQHWRDKPITFETAQIKSLPTSPDEDFTF
ncbi:hypothetical protein [Bradyrhizobium embrapense]